MKKSFLLMGSLALTVAACGSHADGNYTGEPMATLTGTVTNKTAGTPKHPRLLLLWVNFAASPDVVEGQSIEVATTFPATINMPILLPPKEEALNDFTKKGSLTKENRVGSAAIIVYNDLNNNGKADGESEPFVGGCEDYMVVYLEKDVLMGSLSSRFVHGTLTAGYHLMRVERSANKTLNQCQQQCAPWVTACLEACASGGCDTECELEICIQECQNFDSLVEAPDRFNTKVDVFITPDLKSPNIY